jgi:hypothetical protein
VRAWGSATVRAWDSATVEAWDSATVEAWGSATVRASGSATVRAWGSATVRAWDSATVEAWGSATVRAWGSATVEAWGACQVIVRGLAKVLASAFVAVTILSAQAKVDGGIQITPPDTTTGAAWCEFYGVPVTEGVAVLYKAVQDDWRGTMKTTVTYRPGEIPAAPDWDGGKAECGGGLHFFAHPWEGSKWCDGYKHILACPVKVNELSAKGQSAQYPDKVKAPRVCEPVFEVDVDGKRI